MCVSSTREQGRIMEMRCALQCCTPKGVGVGGCEMENLLATHHHRKQRLRLQPQRKTEKWASGSKTLTDPKSQESLELSSWETRKWGGQKGHQVISQ